MTCREFADFLMDYLDGALAADARAAFDRHLRVCPDCVAYLKSYERAVRLGREAFGSGGDALPADVPEEFVQAVLAARRAAAGEPPPCE